MIHRPVLIPYLSGGHSAKLKTCLIFDCLEHAHTLECVYRPHSMLCIGTSQSLGRDLHHVDQIINPGITFREAAWEMRDSYNVILHTDNLDILDEFIETELYGLKGFNVAASTGLLIKREFKELSELVNTKTRETLNKQ